MLNFYTDEDKKEPINFLYNNTNDASFVSIDLNEDKNECDICHQITEEPIVNVMLSDRYLKFEGSLKRIGDSLTKAHEICLGRWSDVIERNLSNNSNSANMYNGKSNIQSTIFSSMEKTKVFYGDETKNCDCGKEKDTEKLSLNLCSSIKSQSIPKSLLNIKISDMSLADIKTLLQNLESCVTEESCKLVDELQLRDKLSQEISGQQALIAQLLSLQKTKYSIPRQVSPNVQNNVISKASISV